MAAELVYGETLRLFGEFLAPRPVPADDNTADYLKALRQHFHALGPVGGTSSRCTANFCV